MIDYHRFCQIKHLHAHQGLNASQIAQEVALDRRTVAYWLTQEHEGVSELWICYPVCMSEWNSTPRAIASHDDYPNPALSLLPRHRYRATW
jgi:hypothetical protein